MPPKTSNPAEIKKLDRKKNALVLLRQGVDIRTISEQVDLTEEYVRNIAREEMEYLSLATQEIQEHFVAMTFARSEKIMSRIMPDFDIEPPPFPDSYDPKDIEKWRDDVKYYRRMISEGAKNWALVTRVQKDVLQVKGVGEKDSQGDVNLSVTNITMTAQGDMYQEALDNIHIETFGETYLDKQSRLLAESSVIMLPSEDRLSKIEKALEHIHDDSNTSESDDST